VEEPLAKGEKRRRCMKGRREGEREGEGEKERGGRGRGRGGGRRSREGNEGIKTYNLYSSTLHSCTCCTASHQAFHKYNLSPFKNKLQKK
jgi:hypothetical protein